MFREAAQIALAISLSANKLPQVQVKQYADVMQKQAVQIGIDPLLFVAVASHESFINEQAISKDFLDFGLLQIRAKNVGGDWRRLLIGVENIRVGAYLFRINKEFCQRQLGREPENEEWLSCYAGQCTTKPRLCKPTKMSRQFEEYRKCLEVSLTEGQDQKCGRIYGRPN